MKKTIVTLLAFLLLLAGLTSCGEKAEPIDLASLAEKLIAEAEFTDELVARRPEKIAERYNVENYADAVCYATGGATAEEIALFEGNDKKAADAIYERMESYLSSQLRSYESYNPDGVVNLEKAILSEVGNNVIYIVCADDAGAAEVLSAFLGK